MAKCSPAWAARIMISVTAVVFLTALLPSCATGCSLDTLEVRNRPRPIPCLVE